MNLPQGEYCTIEYAVSTEAHDKINFSDQSDVFKTTTVLSEGYAKYESEVGWKSMRAKIFNNNK